MEPVPLTGRDCAVLCPGPSLAHTYDKDNDHDLIIGVNRVPIAFECDYMCMLDVHTYEWIIEDGGAMRDECILVTRERTWKGICEKYGMDGITLWDAQRVLEHVVNRLKGNGVDPGNDKIWKTHTHGKSVTLALCVAYACGAKNLRIYGMDMIGQNDWDGTFREQQRRKERRWKDEAEKIEKLFHQFRRGGCDIDRVMPQKGQGFARR